MTNQTVLEDRPAPGWPKVVGILSTIFGILAITCGVGGVALMFASDKILSGVMGSQLPDGVPPPPMAPSLDAIMIASATFGLIVNVILILAGISLIRRKPSGRSLHLVYALLAVVTGFFSTYAGFQGSMKQQQALEAWIEQHGDTDFGKQIKNQQAQQAGMQQTIRVAGTAVGLAVALAWPTFCIVWFGMVKRDADTMLGSADESV